MNLTNDYTRCAWVTADKTYIDYHDQEWGKPVKNDRLLFEMLMLEGAQAGLSWLTILKRREAYRLAFANFHVNKVARFNSAKIEKLMQNAGIIRHRLKIESTVTNAKALLELLQQEKSFADYLWGFVDHQTLLHRYHHSSDVPTHSSISDAMAKDLKQRGFKFVGTKICYAFMQAVGMVDDHTANCFLYKD